MTQHEVLYGVEIQRADDPSKRRLLWDGFERPFLVAHRQRAVVEKNAAVDCGWRKARVVKVAATLTWE